MAHLVLYVVDLLPSHESSGGLDILFNSHIGQTMHDSLAMVDEGGTHGCEVNQQPDKSNFLRKFLLFILLFEVGGGEHLGRVWHLLFTNKSKHQERTVYRSVDEIELFKGVKVHLILKSWRNDVLNYSLLHSVLPMEVDLVSETVDLFLFSFSYLVHKVVLSIDQDLNARFLSSLTNLCLQLRSQLLNSLIQSRDLLIIILVFIIDIH